MVKYVPEGEYLLTKNTVTVNDKKEVNDEVNDYVIQRPNQLVLGVPLPLHFYNLGNKEYVFDFEQWKSENPKKFESSKNLYSEKQTKGYRNFKYNVHQWYLKNGEAPVIYDSNKAQQTLRNLEAHYFYQGYFNAKASLESKIKKENRIELIYKVETGSVSTINNYTTAIESKVLDSIYQLSKEKSLVKVGKPVNYKILNNELGRISTNFRNSGIYRFNKNVITFDADSSKYKTDLTLIINDSIGNRPFRIQKIKNVNIYTDYSYNKKDNPIKDNLVYNSINFLSYNRLNYNPKLLLNSVFIEPNSIYKDKNRELTRKHLRRLNNFRSVEIKYNELDDDFLEASIFLTPMKKYSIGLNTELTHSNIRQLGISGKLSFSNRNVFKGSEILKFSVQGSFLDSKDAANNDRLLNAWELGADVSLELPRFFTPFNSNRIIAKEMSPKTTFTIGTSLQKNIGLDKQKFTGIIDYSWETSSKTNHSFELLNAQFIKNLNIDSYFNIYQSEFDDINEIAETYFSETLTTNGVIDFIDTNINSNFEDSNPSEFRIAQNIKNRYDIITEDVLVPAITYTFTYNNSENYKDTDFSFFRTRLVSSGNLTTLLLNEKDENGKETIFKTPVAQFLRTDFEYKKFWNFSSENVLAFRSFLGVAIPYGNSETIPFSRSYFIGGPNDLRAWKIYDLGPGSTNTGLEYNVGSLKFLTSLEYRFKILNSIKGAFFVDAGNIWDITNSEVTDDEAKFNGIQSLEDIAIGSGFGIRYDLSFILLRLDLGFKTYEPYNTKGNRWFRKFNFNNTVYNFGISYPF